MGAGEVHDELAALLVRVSLRDRAAFDHLYVLVSAKLFGVCLRVLKDRPESEDAVQEVFVKIWLKADRFTVTGQSPMSWLIAIARHHAIDRLRARRDTAGGIDDLAMNVRDPAGNPETLALAAGERRRIDGCMDKLDAARADAVRGAYLDGDSYADLAVRHGVPLNTMRTWLRRSLMQLKECLER